MESIKQKSWFGRNWLWVLPVGGCITVILIIVFGIGALFFGISNVINDSTPVEYALKRAENNTEVNQIFGHNIEIDGMFNGNLSLNDDGGIVDISIPIKGKKGYGKLIVKGEKFDGEWVFEDLYIVLKGSAETINLLDKSMEGLYHHFTYF